MKIDLIFLPSLRQKINMEIDCFGGNGLQVLASPSLHEGLCALHPDLGVSGRGELGLKPA